jgi:hypothetical protein
MYLARHQTQTGPRRALDGHYLPQGFSLVPLQETICHSSGLISARPL